MFACFPPAVKGKQQYYLTQVWCYPINQYFLITDQRIFKGLFSDLIDYMLKFNSDYACHLFNSKREVVHYVIISTGDLGDKIKP